MIWVKNNKFITKELNAWELFDESNLKFLFVVDVSKHPLFVGEFSLEVTDCQKYLDGGYAEPYVPPSKNFNQLTVNCMKFSQSVL